MGVRVCDCFVTRQLLNHLRCHRVQDMVKSLDEFEKDSILMHCSMWVVIYCL